MTTLDIMNELKPKIYDIISQMPYSDIRISTLGGNENAAILFVIGLDKKETWKHGIFENSRYMRFHLDKNSKGFELECFTNSMRTIKFRKVTANQDKILIKIQEFVKKLNEII